MYGMLSGAMVLRENDWFWNRPAVKNQMRSFMIGPPSTYSYWGTTLSTFDGVPPVPQVAQSAVNGCASLPVT